MATGLTAVGCRHGLCGAITHVHTLTVISDTVFMDFTGGFKEWKTTSTLQPATDSVWSLMLPVN